MSRAESEQRSRAEDTAGVGGSAASDLLGQFGTGEPAGNFAPHVLVWSEMAVRVAILRALQSGDARMREASRVTGRLRALYEQLESEPLPKDEPATSVYLGRQQVADELRAILGSNAQAQPPA